MTDFFASDTDFDTIEDEVTEDFDSWMDAMLAGPGDN